MLIPSLVKVSNSEVVVYIPSPQLDHFSIRHLSQHLRHRPFLQFSAAMEAENNTRKGRRPPPRRGQVKARILGSLVRAVIPKGFRKGEKAKEDGGDGGSSADITPTLSGYSSSYEGE
ncbi:hypothetical protein OPV22_031678 [Ensete ventricosum]|uniref:Uncharacterized protein n=1 Tax=Ensete ventricosum TaxID=4639 RepID=A0AAV8PTD7_ENSVE|nr:hypothetical protein OPV22_031678 [Ensete ventricosum]RWW31486.1 hypothetical protein GW17_00003886 [Ensete ventricosum]RWW56039.1 hypothetical protein BHE74_00037282 [Ensete ventricosum]RZS19670.1 hypothetical protein BHM03_00052089 [Ensete ventricosum]